MGAHSIGNFIGTMRGSFSINRYGVVHGTRLQERVYSKPEQKKRRAKRNAARSKMEKEGKVKKGDGKDVDHKNRNPNNNSTSNLRVTSQKKNRGRLYKL